MKTKRISAALLAACLSLTLLLPVSAASAAVSESEAAQVINALGIMVGDDSGDLMLSQSVNRAQFITMAVKAAPGGKQVGAAATSPYPDVPRAHWAAGYVAAGVAAGFITGYTDGTFKPNNPITLAQGAAISLQLLGYTAADFSGAFPTGQMALFNSLKLDRGVSVSAYDAPLTRRDCMYIFYNLLSAVNKAGQPHLTTLGYSLNSAGEVDLLSLLNAVMEGPVTVQSGWQSAIPFDVSAAKVYRAGKAAALSAIQTSDVVYWCAPMRTLWAYGDKAAGTIQALSPSSSAPTAVTVAGRTYAIETSAAAFALSDLGEYGVGDAVTLLLGRSGGVAAVADPSAAQSEVCGVVTTVSKESWSDGKGGSYTTDAVTLTATDGQTYRYSFTSGSYKAGNLLRASVGSDGAVSLKSLSSASLSGKVSADGTRVGSTPLAGNVEILDVYEGSAVRVYPSRLAGLTLSGDMVRYYSKNNQGEIDRLILKDVTGDMHQYGVLTELVEIPTGQFSSVYTYAYDVGGVAGLLSQSASRFSVEKGPIAIKGDLTASSGRMTALTAAKNGELNGNQLVSGSQKYTLSDGVTVYEYRDGDYYLSSPDRARSGDFTLTGWYDKAESAGGRIRVIIAKA